MVVWKFYSLSGSGIQEDYRDSVDDWTMIEQLLDLNTNLIEEGTRCRGT